MKKFCPLIQPRETQICSGAWISKKSETDDGKYRNLLSGFNQGKSDMNDEHTPLLNENQAVGFLGLKPRTLQAWRWSGGVPKFVRLSARAVRYRQSDLNAFVAARLVGSTSEESPKPSKTERTLR